MVEIPDKYKPKPPPSYRLIENPVNEVTVFPKGALPSREAILSAWDVFCATGNWEARFYCGLWPKFYDFYKEYEHPKLTKKAFIQYAKGKSVFDRKTISETADKENATHISLRFEISEDKFFSVRVFNSNADKFKDMSLWISHDHFDEAEIREFAFSHIREIGKAIGLRISLHDECLYTAPFFLYIPAQDQFIYIPV